MIAARNSQRAFFHDARMSILSLLSSYSLEGQSLPDTTPINMARLRSLILTNIALLQISRNLAATLVGDIRGYQYGVAGKLFAINESALLVQDFEYSGQGPDAFFLVGTSGSPSTSGKLLTFPFTGTFFETMDQQAPVLDRRFSKVWTNIWFYV